MRTKATLAILLNLLFTTLVFATEVPDSPAGPRGTVRGRVLDREGRPIAGATVQLRRTMRGLATDQNGQFLFSGLPVGEYELELTGVGIAPEVRTLSVQARNVTELTLTTRESVQELNEVVIRAVKGLRELETLPDVQGTALYAGKKSEVINLNNLDANLITNTMRQVFSKTPGMMVWESDGSGVQVGVAVRGLSPNRSWEFNVRQNGYHISSDPFGYPEAYYNPPMEAVERIELVRGGAGLQYGGQFGGLLNYVLKKPSGQPFSLETQQSVGSYGLFSSFNMVSGTVGRLTYQAYAHYRRADGWRENSQYAIFNGFGRLEYAVTNRLKIGAEVTRMQNESQQPGGLTDAQFAQNSRQSSRARNWFNTPWLVPALTADWTVSDRTQLSWKTFGLIADRNSIGFVQAITTPDVPNAAGQLQNRQIDRDAYRNWGSELRMVTKYNLLRSEHALSAGISYFNGHTNRRQQGRGDAGSDFNLNLQTATFPRDLHLSNTNVALFAENMFRLTPRWTVTPGVRAELFTNDIAGRLSVAANGIENRVQQRSDRQFVLFGVGTEFKLQPTISLYANASQAYRPVLFSDLTPAAVTDFVIDPNLRDARGFTLDAGLRGRVHNYLNFDVGVYHLDYGNRIGTLTLPDVASGRPYQLRTNLGRSVSRGVEAYVEFDPIVAFAGHSRVGYVSLFTSVGYNDARYRSLRSSTTVDGRPVETSLAGRRVENAPEFIGRFGMNYTYKTFTLTALINRVGMAYSDANNTAVATANAQTGPIPAYTVGDVAATYKFAGRYNIRAGVNNVTDARYFTRRAGGYPGPGILPADGRTAYLSVGLTL